MSISNEKVIQYFSKNNIDGFCTLILSELKGKKLIGEIELEEGKETFDNLQSYLKNYGSVLIENESLKIRSLLSVYLVWLGIYNYGLEEEKTYWRHFFKSLNLPEKNSSIIGQKFLRTISELNLQTFLNIEEKNHTYISRILLHGFIPDKDMERFISEFILDNSYNESFYTSSDLINRWKVKIPTKVPKVPTSVERFIKYANPVNEIVIDRFLEIKEKWDYSNQGENENWGLPDYMVKAFFKSLKKTNKNIIYKSGKKLIQLPELRFSLDGFLLYIPSQILGTYQTEITIKCISKTNTQIIKEELLCYRNNNSYISNELTVIVPISEKYEINLIGNQYNIYSNTINSGNNNLTFFIFSSSDNKYINIFGSNSIPKEIVLVTESKTNIITNNIERITEESEFIHGWKYCYYKLDSDSEIELVKGLDDKKIKYNLPIKSSLNSLNISFEGGNPLPYWVEALNNFPIFSNQESLKLKISGIENSVLRIKITSLDTQNILYNSNLNNLEYFNFSSLDKKLKSGLYEIKISQNLSNPISLNFILLNDAKFDRFPEKCSIVAAEKITFSLPEDLKYEILDIKHLKINRIENKVEIENINTSCCRLKILTDTANPLTLLLARMDIKWSRHTNKGIIDWNLWTVYKEDLSLIELNSLNDKRVLVELNNNLVDKRFESNIKLELKDNTDLLTFLTPKLIRKNNKVIFIFDLSGFASQLKDLRYFSADLVLSIPYTAKLELFNLSIHPKFENFLVKTLSVTDKEKVEISWKYNEKITSNTINFVYAPASDLEKVKSVVIPNQNLISISLPLPELTEKYLAYLEINTNKFKSKTTIFDTKRPNFSWIRSSGYKFNSLNLRSIEQDINFETIEISWDEKKEEFNLDKAFVYYSCINKQELFYEILPKNTNSPVTLKLPCATENERWKAQVFVFEDNFDIKNINTNSTFSLEWFRKKTDFFSGLKISDLEVNSKSESLLLDWDFKNFEKDLNKVFVFAPLENLNLMDFIYIDSKNSPCYLELSLIGIISGIWRGYLTTQDDFEKTMTFDKDKDYIEWNRTSYNEIKNNEIWNKKEYKFFKNIRIDNIKITPYEEIINLSWDYKPDEPNGNKFFIYFSVNKKEEVRYSPITNSEPYQVIIEKTNIGGLWRGFIEVFDDEIDLSYFKFDHNRPYAMWERKSIKEGSSSIDYIKQEVANTIPDIQVSNPIEKTKKIEKNIDSISLSIKEKLKNKSNKLKELRDSNRKEKEEITKVNIIEVEEVFFENLITESIGFTRKDEKIIINWEYKVNEPRRKNLLLYNENNNLEFKLDLDNVLPPFIINLPIINIDKSYTAFIEYSKGNKFLKNENNKSILKRKNFISRIIPFYNLSIDEEDLVLKNYKKLPQLLDIFDYFIKFIGLFNSPIYNIKREFLKFIGQKNIELLIPYTNGQLNVKVNKEKLLVFKIINSEYTLRLDDVLSARYFYKLPKKINLDLTLIKKDDKIMTIDESNFALNINNELITVNNEKFDSIKNWISSLLYLKGKSINSIILNPTMPLNIWLTPPNFSFLSDLKNTHRPDDKEENYLFNYLIKEWRYFYNNIIENKVLFDNVQIDLWFWYRLNKNKELDFLSGCISIFYRLRSYNNSFIKFKIDNPEIQKEFILLMDKTTFFIKKYKSIEFLRDLVLTELFINWYFYKDIYQYHKKL